MSSDIASPRPGAPESYRPLPARPNLEFERKRAKKLLRELRRADPGAKLADAQFAIAREYGFLSWPKLVLYFEALERQELSRRHDEGYPTDHYDGWVRTIIAEHRDRRAWTALSLASLVPRFYGKTADEVFASTVTIDDARLVTARQNAAPSWEVLLERSAARRERRPNEWEQDATPGRKIYTAIEAGDLAALKPLIDAQPEVLRPATPENPEVGDILKSAIWHEWPSGSSEARQISDWLVSRGADLRSTLSRMLIEPYSAPHLASERIPEYLEFLFARGADANWLPPNGISLLEHALVRFPIFDKQRGVAVIAKHAKIKKALWIAAGLGDVAGTRRFFTRDGHLSAAARRARPDLGAIMSPGGGFDVPDADDNHIMFEAFYIAAINDQTATMDVLLQHGLPIDYAAWGAPLVNTVVQGSRVRVVEFLVARGANLDIKGWRPHATARELAAWALQNDHAKPEARRVFELCGGTNPDAVIQQLHAQYQGAKPAPRLLEMVDGAREEAVRLGQPTVEADNLFVAMLRDDRALPLVFLRAAGADVGVLQRLVAARLTPLPKGQAIPEIPMGPGAQAALDTAKRVAEERRREQVTSLHLLFALVSVETGQIADILARVGGSRDKLLKELSRAF